VKLENSIVFPLNINLGNFLLYLTKYACFFKLQTSQFNKRMMAHFSSRKPKPGIFLHVPQTQHKSFPSTQVMWRNCNASRYYLTGNMELGYQRHMKDYIIGASVSWNDVGVPG